MPRIEALGKWNAVELPNTQDIYDDNLFACLDGVEELTEYELHENESCNQDKPTSRKTKTFAEPASPLPDGIEPEQESPKTNKKSLKAKQVLTTSRVTDDDEEQVSVEDNSNEWGRLHLPALLAHAVKQFGFIKPTAIQEQIIPVALGSKRDVVGAAETGSGKTLAFLIPLVHHMSQDLKQKTLSNHATSALILLPTRELAQQVYKTLMQLLTYFYPDTKNDGKKNAKSEKHKLRGCLIIGGLSREKQQRLLGRKPHIVVVTPGRVWDQFQTGEECLQQLSSLKYLVIDEADRMVEKGHFPELSELLFVLNAEPDAVTQRQNYIFSATLLTVPPQPKRLLRKKISTSDSMALVTQERLKKLMQMVGFKPNPKVVDLTREKLIAKNVHEYRVLCTNDNKDHVLYYLLVTEARQRTLVFCNSIDGVRRLRGVLSQLFTVDQQHVKQKASAAAHHQRPVVILHSKMLQKQRLKYMERFTDRSNAIFLCTDVAARGLDFPHVEHVIHYQVPRTFELYVHRSGRTARAAAEGSAMLMLAPSEVPLLHNIMSSMKRAESDLPVYAVDHQQYERLVGRVDVARRLDILEHQNKRTRSNKQWADKTLRDADVPKDAVNRSNIEEEEVEAHASKRQVQLLRRRLNGLLETTSWTPTAALAMSERKFPSAAIARQSKRKLADVSSSDADQSTAKPQKKKVQNESSKSAVLGIPLTTSKGVIYV